MAVRSMSGEAESEGRRSLELLDEAFLLSVDARVRRGDLLNRTWAASLLLTGAMCGLVAFLLATTVGLSGSLRDHDNYNACYVDQPCKSGRSYHAETVSEMVSRPQEPAGKIFVSFTMIASICLIISRYPWELKNVYVTGAGGGLWRAMPSLRAVVPPLGMLIVAFVPVVPRADRTNMAIRLTCDVHTLGAVMFVAGYNAFEGVALWTLWRTLCAWERRLRFLCVAASSIAMVIFVSCGALYAASDKLGLCCTDEYVDSVQGFLFRYGLPDNASLVDEARDVIIRDLYGKKMLSDSASGVVLFAKKTEFWAEEFAGLAIILSHFVIWYYCEKRSVQDSP